MKKQDEQVKVAITHGDVNGIGYEVIIKTLLDNRINEMCTPVVYGSAKVAAYHKKVLNINNFNLNSIRSVEDITHKKANLINCVDDAIRVELGRATTPAGEASFKSLELATNDLLDDKVDVMITGPINKYNIQSAGFTFPGHTEYLADKSGVPNDNALMLMVSENLRIGVATGHIPVAKVPEAITEELILQKLRIMNNSLLTDFGVRKPRIAVLGLNPHSGDKGVIGSEEVEIIEPAIQKANEEGMVVLGPYPADGFFGSGEYGKFDAVLAMYHDQGLIPFKALEGERGVNYTAGLPIVRTSPAHGTAYEIAGKGVASEESFRQALYLAIDVFKNRKQHKELSSNPLASYSETDID